MFSALKFIADTILSPFKIIILVFGMLVDLFTVVGEFFSVIFVFIPASWLVIGTVLIAVCILYKILGRESGD